MLPRFNRRAPIKAGASRPLAVQRRLNRSVMSYEFDWTMDAAFPHPVCMTFPRLVAALLVLCAGAARPARAQSFPTMADLEARIAVLEQEVAALRAHSTVPTSRPTRQPLKEYDPLVLDGWRFVLAGEQLFLCPPHGAACRSF